MLGRLPVWAAFPAGFPLSADGLAHLGIAHIVRSALRATLHSEKTNPDREVRDKNERKIPTTILDKDPWQGIVLPF